MVRPSSKGDFLQSVKTPSTADMWLVVIFHAIGILGVPVDLAAQTKAHFLSRAISIGTLYDVPIFDSCDLTNFF